MTATRPEQQDPRSSRWRSVGFDLVGVIVVGLVGFAADLGWVSIATATLVSASPVRPGVARFPDSLVLRRRLSPISAASAAAIIGPIGLMVDHGLHPGVVLGVAFLATRSTVLGRADEAAIVLGMAALGAYLGPPDTEGTFVVAAACLAVGGGVAATGRRPVRPSASRALGGLLLLLLSSLVDASSAREASLYGALLGLTPMLGLSDSATDRRFDSLVPVFAASLIASFVGNRVVGRFDPVWSVAVLVFVAMATLLWSRSQLSREDANTRRV